MDHEAWKIKIPMNGAKLVRHAELVHPLAGEMNNLQLGMIREKRDAVESSYNDGYADGLAQGRHELQLKIEEFSRLESDWYKSILQTIPQVLEESLPQLVELAVSVAEVFISRQKVDYEKLESDIQSGISNLSDSTGLEICMNSMDVEMLQASGSRLFERTDEQGKRIELKVSSEVSAGGFLLNCRMGAVDYTREKRIEKIHQVLEVGL